VPTVEQVTDPHVHTYTPPPEVGDGVCRICHSWTGTRHDGTRYDVCSSCQQTVSDVTRPLDLIVPFSLDVVTEQLHGVLWGYKNSRSANARQRFRMQVAAILARFLRDHGDCIRRAAGRGWDVVTIVPSSGDRAGTHPLETAVRMARAQRDIYRLLLERTDVELDHRHADETAFRAHEEVHGRRVLLIDDTFTTGARVQSAASALALAGADVVAGVVIGRVVRPGYAEEAQTFWDERRGVAFEFDRCCLGHEPVG
jgi:predicted amidophosphoribosyltransferase